jgi:hypothetical protein
VIYIAESQPPLSRYSGRPHESTRPVRPLASYPAANWSAIEELRAHTVVAVVTTSGARHEGSLIGVDETALGIDFRGAELHISGGRFCAWTCSTRTRVCYARPAGRVRVDVVAAVEFTSEPGWRNWQTLGT